MQGGDSCIVTVHNRPIDVRSEWWTYVPALGDSTAPSEKL